MIENPPSVPQQGDDKFVPQCDNCRWYGRVNNKHGTCDAPLPFWSPDDVHWVRFSAGQDCDAWQKRGAE